MPYAAPSRLHSPVPWATDPAGRHLKLFVGISNTGRNAWVHVIAKKVSDSFYAYIYTWTYTCTYKHVETCVYIYIHIRKEREIHTSYIYIYI